MFKSPGSVQSKTSEGGWANTSWFTPRPAFPQFSRGFEFNSRRIATYKHVLRQLYFFVPVFFISLSNLCIQPLSRGGWSYGQPLHLWKICRYKFNCSSAENVSKLSFFWPGGQGVFEKYRIVINKYLYEVIVPSLQSDLEPMQRQENLVQWLLLAHFVPVPADCVCRWADWRWSPLRGSSEQGLHHPICPGDPPFETGRTKGIEKWRVRERKKGGKEGQSSLV